MFGRFPDIYKGVQLKEKRKQAKQLELFSLESAEDVEKFCSPHKDGGRSTPGQSLEFFIEEARKKNTPSSHAESGPTAESETHPGHFAIPLVNFPASDKKKVPMTCTNIRSEQLVQTKPVYSPQNLSSMLLSNQPSDSRRAIMAKLLREKIGEKRFEELSKVARESGTEAVVEQLYENEKGIVSLVRFVFSSPPTPNKKGEGKR